MTMFREDFTAQAFLLCAAAGGVTVVVYDLFRFVRRLPFVRENTKMLLDCLFCIFAVLIAFLVALPVSFGRLRIYQLAGESVGVAVYYLTVGRLLRWAMKRIYRFAAFFSQRQKAVEHKAPQIGAPNE